MKKPSNLSLAQYRVLKASCGVGGTATYAMPEAVKALLALGLVETRNDYWITATTKGREALEREEVK